MGQYKINAIILAGGKSSRMGKDKGTTLFNNQALIEYVIKALMPIVDKNICIIANSALYNHYEYKVYKDEITDSGPMGGIYTGLLHSDALINFVCSCDMPFLSTELFSFLLKNYNGQAALIAANKEHVQPLCSIYHKNCLAIFKDLLLKGELKLKDSFLPLKAEIIDVSGEAFFHENLFQNMNTPQDLKK